MKITLPPENVWITGCTHFFHKNITKGVSLWPEGGMRDFDNEFDMSNAVAKSINDRVKKDDILIIDGDFSFGGKDKIIQARKMINCENIYLILGNHCYSILHYNLKDLFTKTYGDYDTSSIVKFQIGEHKYVVCHYALKVWEDSHKQVRCLYSHSHGTLADDPNSLSFDIGWDCHNRPLSFIEVEQIINKKKWKQIDHHGLSTN